MDGLYWNVRVLQTLFTDALPTYTSVVDCPIGQQSRTTIMQIISMRDLEIREKETLHEDNLPFGFRWNIWVLKLGLSPRFARFVTLLEVDTSMPCLKKKVWIYLLCAKRCNQEIYFKNRNPLHYPFFRNKKERVKSRFTLGFREQNSWMSQSQSVWHSTQINWAELLLERMQYGASLSTL